MSEIDTHHVVIDFGKHKGELLTRAPVGYLRWMVNEITHRCPDCRPDSYEPWSEYARAEIERRGSTLPEIEISGHAIDTASLRIRKVWHENRAEDEGLHAWLMRVAQEARQNGERRPDNPDRIRYMGVDWCFEEGDEFPVLKTVMRKRK